MFPDGTGVLTYNLSKPPAPPPPPPPVTPPAAAVTPVIGTPSATPLRAIAGKPMVVTFPVTRSDTGKPLATGKMICDPSVAGGKVIPHSESFKAGKARLSFVVPRTAKDKQLTVKVTIRTAGGSATQDRDLPRRIGRSRIVVGPPPRRAPPSTVEGHGTPTRTTSASRCTTR